MAGFLNATRLEEYLIDTPTAKVAPVKTLASTSRVFSEGGLLTSISFIPLNRLLIGTSLTFEHLVGTNDQDIKVLEPSLQLKYQLFDGTETWPMFALGFNNQGLYYDHDEKKYLQKAKGLYLVATKELFTEGLLFNLGGNITTDGFEFDKVYGFTAVNYNVADYFALMVEWDNLRNIIKESRLNAGIRFYIVDFFELDFAVRNCNNKAERILQLRYNYTF